MRDRAAALALVAAGMALLSGCGGSGGRLTLDDGTAVLVGAQYRGAVPAIGIGGTIVDLEGDCLGLDEGYRTPGVLVLEHGTVVTSEGDAVLMPDGVTLRVGDEIYGGSGGGGASDPDLQEEWRAALPDCFEGRELAAVSDIKISAP